jgi:hypothetical protein
MIMTGKQRLGLLAACAVLAVAAVTGWVRKPSLALTPNAVNTEPVAIPGTDAQGASRTALPAADGTVTYDQFGQPIGSGTAFSGSSYVTPSPTYPCEQPESALPFYASRSYVRIVRPEPAAIAEEDHQFAEPGNAHIRRTHHRRSTGKSVAIVAGTAGVGAAIGAIAGGGKGAGIGALAGGAGGFIYDRLTHHN